MDNGSQKRFARYVAIGDSSTAGLDDRDRNGHYRGWSRRLAERLAGVQGELLYANFGVPGWSTRQILKRQVEPAAQLRPDLVTVFSGTNDVLERRFDADRVRQDAEHIQRRFIDGGATVLTFTLPDIRDVMPMARGLSPRIRALNEALRAAAERTGATLVDFAQYPVGSDPRLWSKDRLHANSHGHARIADALSHALGLPGTDESWKVPLPPPELRTRREWLAAEVAWTRHYLLPWVGRWILNHFSEDKCQPRQPTLQPVEPRADVPGAVIPTAVISCTGQDERPSPE